MAKVVKFIKKKFPKKSGRLETDAAPVPGDNCNNTDEENNTNQRQLEPYNREISINSLDIIEPQRQNSLTPLKQHRLVEASCEAFNGNRIVQQNNTNHYNGAIVPTNAVINNTQAQNVFQISNANGVHIGNSYSFATQTSSSEIATSTDMEGNRSETLPITIKKTKTIDEMMKSDYELNSEMLDIIATHLIKWKDVARKLGFSDGQIEHIYADNYVVGSKETVYQMLLDWSRNDENANIGTLTTVLWRNNNRDAVFYLKKLWKSIKTEKEIIN